MNLLHNNKETSEDDWGLKNIFITFLLAPFLTVLWSVLLYMVWFHPDHWPKYIGPWGGLNRSIALAIMIPGTVWLWSVCIYLLYHLFTSKKSR